MTIRVEIPGVGVAEFPDSWPVEKIQAEARNLAFGVTEQAVGKSGKPLPNLPKRPPTPTSWQDAFADSATSGFVNNLAKTPQLLSDVVAGAAAAYETIPGAVENFRNDQPLNLREQFGQEFADQKEGFIPRILDNTRLPGAAELTAVGDAVRSDLPYAEGFQQSLDQTASERAAQRENHPFASMAGRAAGDVATLMTGRAPIVSARAPALRAQREALEKQAEATFKNVPSSLKERLNDVVSENLPPLLKETALNLKRATGKAGGVGIEGATLAMLHDGDAESMFWMSAGGQAAGSASLFLLDKVARNPLGFVATAWVASEMFKAAAPGAQDFFESKDFSIQKAVAGLGLGVAAAMAGAGRLRGPNAEKFPVMFDAITAVPRGAILSRLQELSNNAQNGNTVPFDVMSRLGRQPGYFSENQRRALTRAMNSDKPNAFTQEVERLMKNSPDFRKRVDGL